MINWTKTKMIWAENRPVLSTALATLQEGAALVGAIEGGVLKCQPSTGATSGLAGSKLLGIAMSPRKTFSTNLNSTTVTAPAGGGTALLPVTVVSTSDVGVFLASSGVQIAATTSASSPTNVQVGTDSTTGLTSLTFDPSLAGNVYNVFFTYTMSAAVETGLFGNGSPGFYNTDLLAQVGMFKIGRVTVNNFDPQANWYSGTNAPSVKVIAGGLFTDSGNAAAGFVPSNVEIVTFPTPAFPWLELEIGA